MPLYTQQMSNIKIMKLNGVNIKTVNKTPGSCTFIIKNQFLVGPEHIQSIIDLVFLDTTVSTR